MKIFVSWSGLLTRRVAELIRDWLPNVLQSIEPWVSSEDIEKGEIWFSSIADTISGVVMGIVCLSKDNVTAPWILFEAGGLSKGISKNRVCTLLIDLDPSDLKPPLSNFNATKITKEDMFKLVKTINTASGDKALQDQRLATSFERWWSDFEQKFAEILKSAPATKHPPKRSLEDMTVEILNTVRSIQKTRQDARALTLEGLSGIQPIVNWPPPLSDSESEQLMQDLSKASNGAVKSTSFGGYGPISLYCDRELTEKETAAVVRVGARFNKFIEVHISPKSNPDKS